MFAAKDELAAGEVQDAPYSSELRLQLSSVLKGEFFSGLVATAIKEEGYRRYVKEKYSAISYFIPLLEKAERLAENVSAELAQVFRQNRQDETGYFAGAYHEEYAHDTWRARSLRTLGLSSTDLSGGAALPSTKRHNELMAGVAASEDPYEVFGALLFLELFVVYEMKHMVRAFERDMPDIFPQGGYSYDRFPLNEQEYWYGHALHDTWHYRQIEEKLRVLLEGADDARLGALLSGIEKVAEAKRELYSTALLSHMKG